MALIKYAMYAVIIAFGFHMVLGPLSAMGVPVFSGIFFSPLGFIILFLMLLLHIYFLKIE